MKVNPDNSLAEFVNSTFQMLFKEHLFRSAIVIYPLKCMRDFFICSIKSPQCTDMYSKEKFSIAIFLCDVISGLQAPAKRNDTIVRYL